MNGEIGKYAEVSMGASSCRDCPLGTAANSDGRFGADGCISCDPGILHYHYAHITHDSTHINMNNQ